MQTLNRTLYGFKLEIEAIENGAVAIESLENV